MKFQRLQQARIPDLAYVYGGARGRTLSSRHLLYAWKALTEAGVKTVIDLRERDKSNRMPLLCEQYGMRYFHYPIDIKSETMEHMVAMFPEFCWLIDSGDFYIACALGLHRTDIALCIYWVFYGADAAKEPPQLHGYLREKGLRLDKLMRALNAFYLHKTNIEGKEPLSPELFEERKRMIKQSYN